jgi:hypothetical protein
MSNGSRAEGYLLMSRKERERLPVLARVAQGEMRLHQAADVLRISYRQIRRLWARYQALGDAGLVHRHRGKPSQRQADPALRQRALDCYRAQYPDFGPTLAAEKMAERDALVVHPETLRLWLIAAGLWQTRKKRAAHRSWRQRRAHFGELVQMDGSHHCWFEGRAEGACLMSLVDDATGTTRALMAEQETTEAAMQILEAWVREYGVPQALYVDRKNVYVTGREPTAAEQLAAQPPLTQFGRACHKLGIRLVEAHSPQAKGRVERKHGLFQDRLVKEMRLRGISTRDAACALLPAFCAQMNDKYAVTPCEPEDWHRPLDPALELRAVFCREEQRTVAADWTLRYQKRLLQIVRQHDLPPTGRKVIVQEWQDESLHLCWQGRELVWVERTTPPLVTQPATPDRAKPIRAVQPAPEHPWRRKATDAAVTLGSQVYEGLVEQHGQRTFLNRTE